MIYSRWTFGSTSVHSVVGLTHKHLERRYFTSLAAAAQQVNDQICSARTDDMRALASPSQCALQHPLLVPI